ncbi:MAG: HAMP domain-containing histidine kinase, partial [Thermodesulfovibrionia bacterium]|nr:HAMP domain-containing histidine kinase [Thermodesulfovibrionia bacterium]
REVFSKVVIDDIERINRLIKDLLSFSDEKSLTFKENFDVISLIDGILNHLKTKLNLEDRKIYVEKIYKSVKIILSGDSKKLKQAFINIITNACQAIGESGTLKITITPNGKYVDIMINDTGSGISREDIEKIFDPFYTTSPMGMGLGLAISKKIIEDHGGMITVNSEIEQGSTFTVSLPAQN